MWRKLYFISLLCFLFTCPVRANEPDSTFLFAYTTDANGYRNGLHFAWSIDGRNWHSIGPEHGFLKSDYGQWGAEKRMYNPHLAYDKATSEWHCTWQLNATDGFGRATSRNLKDWGRQSYSLDSLVSYAGQVYRYACLDSTAINSLQCRLPGRRIVPAGTFRVPWQVVQTLLDAYYRHCYWSALAGEQTKDDPWRFADLKPVTADILVHTEETKPVSDKLIGIFFEDINYAADGGLYAELIQNRDFEYALSDKNGWDKSWNACKAWEGTFRIDTVQPLHPHNPHYACLAPGDSLTNRGWDGIAVRQGEEYDLSVCVRSTKSSGKQALRAMLLAGNGRLLASASLKPSGNKWKRYVCTLTAQDSVSDAVLVLINKGGETLALDMISLFPRHTFKGRKNGLRADLAQALADLHPSFVRFPGGCVAHGDGLDNLYRWKNSIGPLESRTPMRNLWGYHQTLGLGFYEYFQFCEDIGAEPLPVLAAGVPCQNSAKGTCAWGGQQGGIPMDEMDAYVQDVLDLIEWANGDARTTEWGKIRAQAGHPEPFGLKYIGIGNEDLITDVFEERFTMIYQAVKAAYPDMIVIGTVGPAAEGTDYREGWDLATRLGVPVVDEHYYQAPGWFIYHQDYYDRYDRNKPKVYLGEYAAHLPGRPNNLETALSEALYLTAVERNADVVCMASYAPLLAKEKHTQWNPDLIYFNNQEVKLTTGYQVQKMYAHNSGDTYIMSTMHLSDNNPKVRARIARSVIRDSATGDIIIKLVNLLPVEVQARFVFESGGISGENLPACKTVLTGKPTDTELLPSVSEMEIGNHGTCEMPPYSFVVIRILGATEPEGNQ